MKVELVGELSARRVIAEGGQIREIDRLRRIYGPGRWRKMKGIACVRLAGGVKAIAELHWYESHGIGSKEMRIKRILERIP